LLQEEQVRLVAGISLAVDERHQVTEAVAHIAPLSGELVLEPTEPPEPGDELIVLPVLDPKNFQLTSDLLNLIYQTALSARVFAR